MMKQLSVYKTLSLSHSTRESQAYGFKDEMGQIVVPAKYKNASRFSDGLAAVQSFENNRWGYIDLNGDIIIPFKFFKVNYFNEGYAIVRTEEGLYNLIDKLGQFVFDENYSSITMITPFVYSVCSPFDTYSRLPHYKIYSVRYREFLLGSFHEILLEEDNIKYLIRHQHRASSKPYMYCYSDLEGGNQTKLLYITEGLHFSCGLARICNRSLSTRNPTRYSEKFGFVNAEGEIVIPIQYDSASDFSNESSVVNCDGKWGIIGVTGGYIVPCKYDTITAIDFGYYRIMYDSKYGIMDADTNILIPCKYRFINVFKPNFFIAQYVTSDPCDYKYCIINKEGQETEFKCNAMLHLINIFHTDDDKHLIIGRNTKGDMGVINTDGVVHIPFSYPRISRVKDGFKLETYNEYWIIDLKNNQIDSGSYKITPPYDSDDDSDYAREPEIWEEYMGDAFDGDPSAVWNVD